ncbi:EAL domain-containing protein [uncultured Roseibium sp.]|uniref:putative bifunctional diguanylate cyclase/phosphodiesterase n=1 Tax=uncultured Roseibium sp. TaxID=1936171 RepID=UPI0025975E98|nr:EAL domain-containing protein [uncultured Roseibium sp.]
MFLVLSCIAVAHEARFTLLAALVCILGAFLTVNLYSRLRSSRGSKRYLWLFLVALVGGATIWTTHFSAMLGYIVPLGRTFEPTLTLISLGCAILTSGLAFLLASQGKSIGFPMIGGAVFGVGIAVMHYLGMEAYLVTGILKWDVSFVAWSVVLGGGLGAAALVLAHTGKGVSGIVQAAVVMILAIVLMHFTGMTAITVVPLSGVSIPAQALSDDVMLAAVVGVTLVIIATVGSAFVIDTRNMAEATATYQHLAMHDPLTQLPNRTYLRHQLEEELLNVRDSSMLAVLAIDLDRFKDVNDLHGHGAGDALLADLGRRLKLLLGDGEFVARIGGDEFVAYKSGVADEAEILPFANRLRSEIARPFDWQNQVVKIGGSVGISRAPRDGLAADELLTRADLAAYSAKTDGGDRLAFYCEGMEERSRSRASIALDLKSAIQNGELELYYQPQNDTRTRSLKGFEALVRWNHPERGLVSPTEFIPIAEETGLILDIGAWVLEEACTAAAAWPEQYSVAVNVSALQIAQSTLSQQVAAVLARTNLAPARLEIELTESGLIADQAHALKVVLDLKKLGVSVAMDDFGTGYSSLSTLQNFPFDKIKIDRGFIMSLTANKQSAAIVKSTILLGTSLKIPVLAEGVETEDQLSFLLQEGCQSVQGYLFGKPLRLDECIALMYSERGEKESVLPSVDLVATPT